MPNRKMFLVILALSGIGFVFLAMLFSTRVFHDGWELHGVIPVRSKVFHISDGKNNFVFFDKQTNSAVVIFSGSNDERPIPICKSDSAIFFKESQNPITVMPKFETIITVDRVKNVVTQDRLPGFSWNSLRQHLVNEWRNNPEFNIADEVARFKKTLGIE